MGKSGSIHSDILTSAAKNVLRPLGLIQKGRSRTWLDDRGWWVCVVEFQPSGWSRGSYLNVGCNWLWQPKDYLSFDEGYRVDGFHQYHDGDQFKGIAQALVDRAATEVRKFRELFSTPRALADYYEAHPPMDFWKRFHASVAYGLSGKAERARALFGEIAETDGDVRNWVVAARADAERLRVLADDLQGFREAIISRIQQGRELLGLAALHAPAFF